MKFLVSALIDNKYAGEIWQKSLEQKSVTKSRSKFSCEIVLEFQKQITIRQKQTPVSIFGTRKFNVC